MLKIENLSYRYQTRSEFTLHNINLQLADGEMLLLAGRSGCGKSTLIKAVSGLLGDGAGELTGHIYLNGVESTFLSPEKIGMMVGTVYQSPDDQLFAMTVADEVGFALENQGKESEFIKQRVAETLSLVGLAGFENCSIHKLSGGQRQRLALASILVSRPKLLILDEPVSQMNPQGVQSFMQLLTELNQKENIAILMIEHRVNELAGYFNRLTVMRKGRVVYDGAMKDAWNALTGCDDMGLREPQCVKLCRELHLSHLTNDAGEAAHLINTECSRKNYKAEEKFEEQGKVLVCAENISYTYPGSSTPTLKNVNFILEAGRITALMGFNGAGKSTLMNLLGGLTSPSAGAIYLNEEKLQDVLGHIGYLRQEPDLMLLADTVTEELCWQNSKLTVDAVKLLLKKLNLTEYADDFPLSLSKGQRLRVVLGAILAKKPQLLLLDEPTTGQDEASLKEIRQLLTDYKNSGGCVFICTHDIELAAQVADKVILMQQGRIIADDASCKVLTNRRLLKESGLIVPQLLDICQAIDVPPCIIAGEVTRYVSPSAMGRQ